METPVEAAKRLHGEVEHLGKRLEWVQEDAASAYRSMNKAMDEARVLRQENESLGVTQDQHRLAAVKLRQENEALRTSVVESDGRWADLSKRYDELQARLRTAREALEWVHAQVHGTGAKVVIKRVGAALRDMGDVPDPQPSEPASISYPCAVCGRPAYVSVQSVDEGTTWTCECGGKTMVKLVPVRGGPDATEGQE